MPGLRGAAVKPPRFDYAAVRTVEEAVAALSDPGAVVLAGGQSLLLELVYRERRPRMLVDVNGVRELDAVGADNGALRIGALVRHRALESSDGSPTRRLLARAAPYVAHPPIRSRGTFGGSVAWGHRAAEWNAVCAALGAVVHVRSAHGTRAVPAAEWYVADRRTARQPGELVTAVSLPQPPSRSGVGFAEHRRTHGTFADAAVAAVVVVEGDAIVFARGGVAGPAPVPQRLPAVEDALLASGRSAAVSAAGAAARDPLWPEHLGAVAAELVRRSVSQALDDGAEAARP